MKVCDLVKMLNLTVFCGEEGLDTEITGGYTSDGRGYFKRRLRGIDRERNLSR